MVSKIQKQVSSTLRFPWDRILHEEIVSEVFRKLFTVVNCSIDILWCGFDFCNILDIPDEECNEFDYFLSPTDRKIDIKGINKSIYII